MFRASEKKDIPAIREIWQEAFGDEDRFLDLYFEKYYVPEELWVHEEKGKITSIATLYRNAGLTLADGSVHDCPTLYAGATKKEEQGHGYCIELMRTMMAEYQKIHQNEHFLVMPADDGLRDYYHKAYGFRDWGFAYILDEEMKKSILEADWEPCEARDYNLCREAFLKGCDHISFTDKEIALQKEICRLEEGGDLYCRKNAEGSIVAICVMEAGEEGRKIKEYLAEDFSYTMTDLALEKETTIQIIGEGTSCGYAGLLFD